MTRRILIVLVVSLLATAAGAAGLSLRRETARTEGEGAGAGLSAILRARAAVGGALEHLEALDEIAEAHGGNRAAGTEGYDASVAYVRARLEDAGYEIERQEFDFVSFVEESPTRLSVNERPAEEDSFKVMLFSPAGEARAPVTRVTGGGSSLAGCAPSHFDEFPFGHVALVPAANCRYRDQAANAEAAGATALLVAARREEAGVGVLRGNLGDGHGLGIPVLGTTFELGRRLARGARVHIRVDTMRTEERAENVIAQTLARSDDTVVMIGAHLDSVIDGPGINDNGTGVAALLELAEALADEEPRNAVRFAWWGAEEYGLLGSIHYVTNLDEDERSQIAAYLNFDMIGSPNYVRYVYDGASEPEGSNAIESLLREWFEARELELRQIPLEGRSDHAAFASAGIPVGGLFTGANMLKTGEEVDEFGGEAGIAEDPCYHLACDDLSNVDETVLGQMLAAIAHALGTMASIPEAIP